MTRRKDPIAADATDLNKAAAFVATRADSMTAAAAVRFAEIVGKQDPLALLEEMRTLTKAVTEGDMREPERMLMGQAVALQAMFANLANRAALNMGEHPATMERYMRLALKAQSQCRVTLETLATLKSPPVVYARQANVTTGPQQVNNGIPPDSGARKLETSQSKLLEADDGKWLDSRAAGSASGPDSAMATVGACHGAADR